MIPKLLSPMYGANIDVAGEDNYYTLLSPMYGANGMAYVFISSTHLLSPMYGANPLNQQELIINTLLSPMYGANFKADDSHIDIIGLLLIPLQISAALFVFDLFVSIWEKIAVKFKIGKPGDK